MKQAKLMIMLNFMMLASCGQSVEIGGRQGNDSVQYLESNAEAGPKVRAIGIFRARYDQKENVPVDVAITIQPQGRDGIYLALASYYPVRWRITGPGASSVRGVYLAGFHASSVVELTNVKVQNLSGIASRRIDDTPAPGGWGSSNGSRTPVPCAVDLGSSRSPCVEAEDFISNAERLLGVKLGSFTGIDQAGSFTIKALR